MFKVGPACIKVIDSRVTTVTENVDITDEVKKGMWVDAPTAFMVGTENSGSASYDLDIQVSHDGTNYEEVVSFTQLTSTGHELKAFTIPPWGQYVRAVITLSTTGNWTTDLWLAGPVVGGAGK